MRTYPIMMALKGPLKTKLIQDRSKERKAPGHFIQGLLRLKHTTLRLTRGKRWGIDPEFWCSRRDSCQPPTENTFPAWAQRSIWFIKGNHPRKISFWIDLSCLKISLPRGDKRLKMPYLQTPPDQETRLITPSDCLCQSLEGEILS